MASVPSQHPYVRAAVDPATVDLLPDPPVPGAPAGQWWPPQTVTPAWIDAHAAEFDILHLHFGLESFDSDEIAAGLAAARRAGRPVVYTVHDLDNPQLTDQAPYRAILHTLVPAADHLITLTDAAADEVRRRWNRECTVLPHPTVLTGEPDAPTGTHATDSPVTDAASPVRVGVHVRDLRPNIDALGAVRALAVVADLVGAEVDVVVLMNDRVRDTALAERVIATAGDRVRIERVGRLSDAAVERWIAQLDLFVLPYRHGTHSGWVELCWDLATPVAGTPVGSVGAQHPSDFLAIDLDRPETLVAAVDEARRRRSTNRRDDVQRRRHDRLAERETVRDAHTALYRDALQRVARAERWSA
ncbi:MAG: hypothetical protein ABS61_11555 [Microbacterium sp. SCN 70-18]|nr:glycosyltransferase [Microbacterium chocolatum]ODT09780.1 MAG: hypothetical protein ABS61_11555 [Microbacterium sp. SCN 70-18]